MPTRKPFRTQWRKQEEPPAEPVTSAMEKAKHLPLPGPGIVVNVPLHLLPEYLQLHGLQPNGIKEPKVQPKYGPGEGILLVKRVTKDGKNG